MKQLLTLICVIIISHTTHANDWEVTEYLLSNGLKLIVKEDHSTPTAIVQVWYKVGASYDVARVTGISHAVEHMMFSGTQK